MSNFLLRTDSYKLTHWPQYPKDTEFVYSYLESRGGEYDTTVMAGGEYYLQKYLAGDIFTQHDVDEAEQISFEHFGAKYFNRNGWMRLYKKYGGTLPLRIRMVPEGMVVPVHNVLMTIQNTDPEFPWLTNYVESLLLKLWYPITVATRSRECKKVIAHYLDLTGTPDLIDYKLHDFGYRGVSSEESAAIGGAAHLINFKGSDTLAAIGLLRRYYKTKAMPSNAVVASEHSTTTSWGQEHEVNAFRNMLDQYPTGLVSCVSDSYDIFNACENLWGTQLHDRVMERDGVVIIRPDSGDPCPNVLRILDILAEKFGAKENTKGFRVLDPHIRIIQGDGVNLSAIRRILDTMRWRGWSADNIAFGMGGGLLQQMDRDTQRFAIKCSAIRRSGTWYDVYKTATGKASKRGHLALIREDGNILTTKTMPYTPYITNTMDILEDRFLNGAVLNSPTLSEIRQRAEV